MFRRERKTTELERRTLKRIEQRDRDTVVGDFIEALSDVGRSPTPERLVGTFTASVRRARREGLHPYPGPQAVGHHFGVVMQGMNMDFATRRQAFAIMEDLIRQQEQTSPTRRSWQPWMR